MAKKAVKLNIDRKNKKTAPLKTKPETLSLKSRETEELVIAMVGPIASGCSTIAEMILDFLKDTFGYEGQIIKPSHIIDSNSHLVGKSRIAANNDRVASLQEIGTLLREKFGPEYLVDKCVENIYEARENQEASAPSRRYVTIIDSLKNPLEVRRLQQVYSGSFWLFGVFAPEEIRANRLRQVGLKQRQITEIFTTDVSDGKDFGQQVRDTMHLSDFFIRNDEDDPKSNLEVISRFFDLLFRAEIHTPTNDETGMYAAMSAAAGSSCLSRQVGAAIMDTHGNIIGQGRNDVPKFGGGLYSEQDINTDRRCFKQTGAKCHNDFHKESLIDSIMTEIQKELPLPPQSHAQLKNIILKSPVKSLIEFSRSVHAEMDAILSVARNRAGEIVGSSIYTTTYPCHNCARHIVAAGLSKAVFIEPYTKSKALTLHDDAISESPKDKGKKVTFLQFEGVAPRNMLILFDAADARKVGGKLRTVNKKTARPSSQVPLDGYVVREQLVIHDISSKEGR